MCERVSGPVQAIDGGPCHRLHHRSPSSPVAGFDVAERLSSELLIGVLRDIHIDGGPPTHRPRWYRVLIFSDASCGDDVIGVGYVIRVGDREYLGSTYYECECTSMEAEYRAMQEAIQAASYLRDADGFLNLYTDCDPLVGKLEGFNDCEEWDARRREFLELVGSHDWSLSWLPRERNQKANDLAREGLEKGRAHV